MGLFGQVSMPLNNAFSLWRERLAEVDPEPWVEFLLYSQPALEKRIRMARGFGP